MSTRRPLGQTRPGVGHGGHTWTPPTHDWTSIGRHGWGSMARVGGDQVGWPTPMGRPPGRAHQPGPNDNPSASCFQGDDRTSPQTPCSPARMFGWVTWVAEGEPVGRAHPVPMADGSTPEGGVAYTCTTTAPTAHRSTTSEYEWVVHHMGTAWCQSHGHGAALHAVALGHGSTIPGRVSTVAPLPGGRTRGVLLDHLRMCAATTPPGVGGAQG